MPEILQNSIKHDKYLQFLGSFLWEGLDTIPKITLDYQNACHFHFHFDGALRTQKCMQAIQMSSWVPLPSFLSPLLHSFLYTMGNKSSWEYRGVIRKLYIRYSNRVGTLPPCPLWTGQWGGTYQENIPCDVMTSLPACTGSDNIMPVTYRLWYLDRNSVVQDIFTIVFAQISEHLHDISA